MADSDDDADEDSAVTSTPSVRRRSSSQAGTLNGRRLFDARDAHSADDRKRKRDAQDDERETTPEPVIISDDVPQDLPPSPANQPGQLPLDGLVHEIELSSDDDDEEVGDDDHQDAMEPTRTPRKLRIESHRYAQAIRVRKPPPSEPDVVISPEPKDSDLSISSLSLLASPDAARIARKTFALHETRARAIFDPEAERRAKLAKRMEPVYLPGEQQLEDPQELDEDEDDDWDEAPDGWKAVGVPEDDDW